MVNRILEQCPYCSEDPGGDRSDQAVDQPAGLANPRVEYVPLQSVALFLQLLLGLFIIGSVVELMSAVPYRSLLVDIAAGFESSSDLDLLETRFNTSLVLVTAVYLATSTTFLIWFWRAYKNLSFFERARQRTPGWALGGWFIPFFGMIIPYGIGAEIWTQSRPEPGPVVERRDPNMEPVISWWALFLIMSVVNVVGSFMLPENYTASDLGAYVGVEIVGSLVGIAAAVSTIRFVRLVTDRQESLLAKRQVVGGRQ